MADQTKVPYPEYTVHNRHWQAR